MSNFETTPSIRSTIPENLLKSALLRGSAIALGGCILLLLGLIFFDLSAFGLTSSLFFFVWISLLAYGLRPYRRLAHLQLKPSEIKWINDHQIVYYSLVEKRKMIFQIKDIKGCEFIDNKYFGIKIILYKESETVDVFLPYFSRRAFKELNEWLDYKPACIISCK
jgi:hypothetical protein